MKERDLVAVPECMGRGRSDRLQPCSDSITTEPLAEVTESALIKQIREARPDLTGPRLRPRRRRSLIIRVCSTLVEELSAPSDLVAQHAGSLVVHAGHTGRVLAARTLTEPGTEGEQ